MEHTCRTIGALVGAALAVGVARAGSLTVHEWGTFTSIAGDDGRALEWRPLAGKDDLPGFVYRSRDGLRGLRDDPPPKGDIRGTVRMETPVLYFYADREMEASVSVRFPGGTITEWYPQAKWPFAGIDWGRFRIVPDARPVLPAEQEASHYYAARDTDASPVRVCGKNGDQYEKFLFYRGVGSFPIPLVARLDGDRVVARNVDPHGVAEVVLFEARGGRVGYRLERLVLGDVAIARPQLDATVDQLEGDLVRMLVGAGLYAPEAEAMVRTWHDSWFEDGLRLFYLVPRATTDAVLPITIDPRPDELTRVLVGRIEMLLPERVDAIEAEARRLADPRPDVRAAAMEALKAQGRFARPVLERIARHPQSWAQVPYLQELLR